MTIKSTLPLLAALVLASAGAQAATFKLSGISEQGPLNGEVLSGIFSFNEKSLNGVGSEYLGLTALQVSFSGQSVSLADLVPGAVASFWDGKFVGLDLAYTKSAPKWTLQAGFGDISEAAMTYETASGAGYGSYTVSAVPEPASWAMALAGIAGLVGVTRRRKDRAGRLTAPRRGGKKRPEKG